MTRQDEYAKALEEYAKKNDREISRYNSSVLEENFKAGEHIMLIEEERFAKAEKQLKILQKENSLLEKVDLIDFWNICENGRTDKKR